MTDEPGHPAPGGGGGGKSVKLPVFGTVKRVYVYGAVAAVAVIAGYAYWKRSAGGGGAAAVSPYADLRTGSDTGSDTYAGATDSVSGSAGSAVYDALPATPTTDQQWTAAVVASLTYLEPDFLYGVVGKYLARQGLTSDEAAVIRSAWAAVGRPPGNQQIILATDSSSAGTSKAPATPTGLHLGTVTGTSCTFTWHASTGATSYAVIRSDGATATTASPSFHTDTLTAGKTYSFTVQAVSAAGSSAKSAALVVKTPGAKPATKPPASKPPASKPPVKKPARPTVSAGTVKAGARGDSVKIIQRIVGAPADGIFGPQTAAAVKHYQQAHHLVADGIVGPKTQATMGI